jgi:hypothetical protein
MMKYVWGLLFVAWLFLLVPSPAKARPLVPFDYYYMGNWSCTYNYMGRWYTGCNEMLIGYGYESTSVITNGQC